MGSNAAVALKSFAQAKEAVTLNSCLNHSSNDDDDDDGDVKYLYRVATSDLKPVISAGPVK